MDRFGLLLVCCLLSACGMKGDLVLPEPPDARTAPGDGGAAGNAAAPAETPEEEAKRQGEAPPNPDPDLIDP
jgi:predicted small lipoprotein YifL